MAYRGVSSQESSRVVRVIESLALPRQICSFMAQFFLQESPYFVGRLTCSRHQEKSVQILEYLPESACISPFVSLLVCYLQPSVQFRESWFRSNVLEVAVGTSLSVQVCLVTTLLGWRANHKNHLPQFQPTSYICQPQRLSSLSE